VCNGALIVAPHTGLPLIVAGAPAVTIGLTSVGRVMFVVGIALALAGAVSLWLSARAHRQLTRDFD
jgi:hypothetical protein